MRRAHPRERGRRECQVHGRTHSPMCEIEEAHELKSLQVSRTTDLPCAMVVAAYIVRTPERPAFVSPSPAGISAWRAREGRHRHPASLAPATRAPGPHAFAVRKTVFVGVRLTLRCLATIASRPTCRDDRDTSLVSRRDWQRQSHCSEKRNRNNFLESRNFA